MNDSEFAISLLIRVLQIKANLATFCIPGQKGTQVAKTSGTGVGIHTYFDKCVEFNQLLFHLLLFSYQVVSAPLNALHSHSEILENTTGTGIKSNY